MIKKILFITTAIVFSIGLQAQIHTNKQVLQNFSQAANIEYSSNYKKAIAVAKEKGWNLTIKGNNNSIAQLVGIDAFGHPKYYTTYNNIVAAATTRANQLWPGGSTGLNLSGASISLKNKIAIWDGGAVLGTHQELKGRIEQQDVPGSTIDHATHVSGTMIASGINPLAKGMSYGANNLLAWDFNNDISEISGAASGLLLSNHSYGIISGWSYNSDKSRWEFNGDPGATEDYKFGYYSDDAQSLDNIAYNAPNYLIVKAAGNNRNTNGPAIGKPYYRFDSSGIMVSAGNRPAGISSNDGYDIIPWDANAKNILTIGAVNGLPFGYSQPSDVVISSFSSWGPTDDGRIKPDLVADGVGILSSVATGNADYDVESGTSMATPNVTGTLLLLQEQYNKLHPGSFMLSATLKGLAIHSADEAGDNPGPDYAYGWGLLNAVKAVNVINSNNTGTHLLQENVLKNGATDTIRVIASGEGKITATICWTDVKGNVELVNTLNNRTPKLVNDLDIRITASNGTVYKPWILSPLVPASAATKGDNKLDNVEKIEIEGVLPGQKYTITIAHKGTLVNNTQAYSLLVSGVGGSTYCSSAATATGGTKIDSVSFAGIANKNTTACTNYNNYNKIEGSIQPNQTVPIYIKLKSCDATTKSRVVKVFIDYNGNGIFDLNELAATSNILSGGNASFTTSISTPKNITIGNTTIMRIVAQETTDANTVLACGAYETGETEDYTIHFVNPSNDLSLREILSPATGDQADSLAIVAVRVWNYGLVSKSNFPIAATIKNGATVLASFNAKCPSTVSPNSSIIYTFQKNFNLLPNTAYTVVASVSDVTDQNSSNDTLTTYVTTPANNNLPTGTATICNNAALLNVTNSNANANYFWYTSTNANAPITSGIATSTAIIPLNKTYYVATGATASLGAATNTNYTTGGYASGVSGGYEFLSATVPVTIKTAKLYASTAGQVKFVVNPGSKTANGYNYYPTVGDSVTVDVYPNLDASGKDTGATYYLNLHLDNNVLKTYVLSVYTLNGADLYYNFNIKTNPYPIGIPSIFTITSSNFATNPNSYYLFLYNLKVVTDGVHSARNAVVANTATLPTVTQIGDSLFSSSSINNQWYAATSGSNVLIDGATNKSYKPILPGPYYVVVTDNVSGCANASNNYNYLVTAVNNVPANEIALAVSPNPSNGVFTIRFKVNTLANVSIQLLDVSGKSLLSKSYSQFVGAYAQQFGENNIANGTYILKIQIGNKVYHQKVLIQH